MWEIINSQKSFCATVCYWIFLLDYLFRYLRAGVCFYMTTWILMTLSRRSQRKPTEAWLYLKAEYMVKIYSSDVKCGLQDEYVMHLSFQKRFQWKSRELMTSTRSRIFYATSGRYIFLDWTRRMVERESLYERVKEILVHMKTCMIELFLYVIYTLPSLSNRWELIE